MFRVVLQIEEDYGGHQPLVTQREVIKEFNYDGGAVIAHLQICDLIREAVADGRI